MGSDKDAEIARLTQRLHDAEFALKTSDLLRCEVARSDHLERNRRRVRCKVPVGAYELLEDIGILEAARCGLMRLWHKDEPEFRKMLMHLSKLQWDLREKVRKNL